MNENRPSRAPLVIGLIVGFAALMLTAVYVGLKLQAPATIASSVGGAFSMQAQDGTRFTEANLKGKPSIMFFGFTHCPDICPTALFEITQIMNELGADAQKLNVVFTSVDPARDTPEQLKLYLSSFYPGIIGLSGSEQEMETMAKAYRVYYRKVPLDAGGYTMDHTALVYLMDRNGQFVRPFDIKIDPKEAAAKLRAYL